ncbi:MAG TPA: hypothetical protein VGR11_12565 [Solirubrobacteraceae bacterium]|nr:hypothetical protein [Solirubrobacteraceae bacterium]
MQSAVRPAGGTWQAPTDVSAGGQHAASPQLAVDARGTAVAVWERLRDGNYVVQAAVRPAGRSWGAVADLSRPGRKCRPGVGCKSVVAKRVVRPLLPRLAVDRRGNAATIWERFQGRSSRVQAAIRPVGGRWRAAVDIVRFGRARSQDFAAPQIALGVRGEAIAVWTRRRARRFIVQSALRPAGDGWRKPLDLSAAGRSGGGARVAFDARGNALAVWQLTPPGTGEETTLVQSAARTASGGWTKAVDISAPGAHATGPVVVVDQRGGAIAAWSRSTHNRSIVQSADRTAGGAWRKPVDVFAGQPGTYAGGVDLAIDAGGNAVAAWGLTLPNPGEDDEPPVIAQGAVRPPGAMWQPRSLRGGDNVRGAVRVAIDPRGDIAAIWPRLTPGGYIVVRATVP